MLTPRERLLLYFEDAHPDTPMKEEQIRSTFGFSAVRYYSQLHQLIGRQDAEAEFPMLVHRLRRMAFERVDKRARQSAYFTRSPGSPSGGAGAFVLSKVRVSRSG